MGQRGVRQQLGDRGEDLAVAELESQGMTVVARNWRCRTGEVDVIALDDSSGAVTVVFCEVKCRRGLQFGHPLEAITYAKMRKLRQLAAEWLATHDVAVAGVRIDAVGVLLLPGRAPEVTHVRAVG